MAMSDDMLQNLVSEMGDKTETTSIIIQSVVYTNINFCSLFKVTVLITKCTGNMNYSHMELENR